MIQKIDIDLIRGEISRRSLKEFLKFFWQVIEPTTPFTDNWHIDAICEHLTALSQRQIKNLLINMPPRCTKSTLTSVAFPAFQLIHDPGEQFLCASYSYPLAERDQTRCRRLIQSELYQKCFGKIYQLSEDQNTKKRFTTNKNGGRLVSSVLSAQATGENATILLCDDPHSVQETESALKLENARRWFSEVFFNRLNNPKTGVRLVVGQRIHEQDLSGFILENYASAWTHLNLPWEFNPNKSKATIIGWQDPRKFEGEPLWESRFPSEEIEQLKKKPLAFSAQYNQEPLNAETSLFKKEDFRYYLESASDYRCEDRIIRKSDCIRLMSADLAIATSKTADWTVIVVADLSRTGEIIVLDVFRGRINGTRLVPTLAEYNEIYNPNYILTEDIAFQRVIIDQARLEGLPIRVSRQKGDKEIKSIPLQTKFASHQIWFPRVERAWMAAVMKELIEFPQGQYDDICDSLGNLAFESSQKFRTRKQDTPNAMTPDELKKQEQIRFANALMEGIF